MAPLFATLLLLLLGMFVLTTSARLNSVEVVSYRKSRTTLNGPARCALLQANKTLSSSSLKDCSLKCVRDAACTGLNVRNSTTCDLYDYNPTVTVPVSNCTFYQVSAISNLDY